MTPRTMRLPASMDSRADRWIRRRCRRSALVGSGLVGGVGELDADDLVGGDLFETDAQRLAGNRADLRRNHVAEAVAELVEVRVDLAGPPGGERDQAELGVDACRASSSIGGFIIVSWARAIVQPPEAVGQCTRLRANLVSLRPPMLVDDRQHLVDGSFEVVVDDDVVGDGQPDRLLVERPCAGARRPCPRGRRGHAGGVAARRATAGARRSASRRGLSCLTWLAPSTSISSTTSRAVATARASGCRSSCRGTWSTRGTRRARCVLEAGVIGEHVGVSGSPGRCARVVHDRLSHSLGSRSTSALTIVPLPTPPGPETTMMSGSAEPSLAAMASLAELIEQ